MRSRQWGLVGCLVLVAQPASAQSVERYSVDSAVSINKFTGENAADQPDVVVDVTAAMRLSKGWTAYVRPWFRRPSSVPHEVAAEIYQAAVQYQKPGGSRRASTWATSSRRSDSACSTCGRIPIR